MKDEFFVTLFSNSSAEIYPKNSKSKFTCKLPVSLDFHTNQNYSVGLVDCVFPRIIGTVANSGDEIDVVCFPEIISRGDVYEKKLEFLVNIVLENAKKPSIYNKNYFKDFLNIENLKSFENNPAINRHKVEIESKAQHYFKVYKFQEDMFRDGEAYLPVIFEKKRNYTLNQIIWIICNTYNYITKVGRKTPDLFVKYGINEKHSTSEILYTAVFTFINEFLTQTANKYGFEFEDSDYLLIYTDIIEERIIGDNLSKVLYLTNRDKNTNIEQLDVKNIQYIPVIKQNLDEISVFIADEQGQQIVFVSDTTPTCLTLHFRKNV